MAEPTAETAGLWDPTHNPPPSEGPWAPNPGWRAPPQPHPPGLGEGAPGMCPARHPGWQVIPAGPQ